LHTIGVKFWQARPRPVEIIMDVKDWLVIFAMFACGFVFLFESVIYLRRGIYTKTFKGTSRREYIKKEERRDVYWLNMAFHLCAATAMIFMGFWLMQLDPTVNDWYLSIRKFLTF
jgi:hypothetical protein